MQILFEGRFLHFAHKDSWEWRIVLKHLECSWYFDDLKVTFIIINFKKILFATLSVGKFEFKYESSKLIDKYTFTP
jgi:hypothetical protein